MDKRIFIQSSEMTLDRMLAIAGIRHGRDLFQRSSSFSYCKGTAESGSEHPLALAVRNHCKEHFGVEQLGLCQDFKAIWGYGLQSNVSEIENLVPSPKKTKKSTKYWVLIGNREWMKRNHLKIDDGIDKTMSIHEHDGHTAVLIAIDGKSTITFFI